MESPNVIISRDSEENSPDYYRYNDMRTVTCNWVLLKKLKKYQSE